MIATNAPQQIAEAVEAVEITSPTTYAWRGKVSQRVPRRLLRELSPLAARSHLIKGLQSQLYGGFFVHGQVTAQSSEVATSAANRTAFMELLSKANSGTGSWSHGWRCLQAVGDEAVVARDGLELTVPAMQTRQRPRPGVEVALRIAKEHRAISPGFYFAFGDQVPQDSYEASPGPGASLVRVYWNVTSSGAVPLVRTLTEELNRESVPFRLKVLNDPALFMRCDAAVLYLQDADLKAHRSLFTALFDRLQPHLKPLPPALTYRIHSGIGFACEPGGSSSYGQAICQLIAEGIVRAHEQDARQAGQRNRLVFGYFRDCGISPEHPWTWTSSLNPDIAE